MLGLVNEVVPTNAVYDRASQSRTSLRRNRSCSSATRRSRCASAFGASTKERNSEWPSKD